MSAEVIQLRDFQKPVPQPPELIEQATTLVGFINGLTAKDDPVEFNAALPEWPQRGMTEEQWRAVNSYTETESYTAPDGDCA